MKFHEWNVNIFFLKLYIFNFLNILTFILIFHIFSFPPYCVPDPPSYFITGTLQDELHCDWKSFNWLLGDFWLCDTICLSSVDFVKNKPRSRDSWSKCYIIYKSSIFLVIAQDTTQIKRKKSLYTKSTSYMFWHHVYDYSLISAKSNTRSVCVRTPEQHPGPAQALLSAPTRRSVLAALNRKWTKVPIKGRRRDISTDHKQRLSPSFLSHWTAHVAPVCVA